MKLQVIWMKVKQEIEVTPDEFGGVRVMIYPDGGPGIVMSQVEALSFARMIEELGKDMRRK